MLERKVYTTRVNSIDPPTGFEVALIVAGDVALGRGLDTQASEALSKFATITHRLNEVKRDFENLSKFKMANPRIGYKIGFNENNELINHKISKKEVPEFIRIHKTMAFNLYNTFLKGDENTRLAAREVEDYIRNLL